MRSASRLWGSKDRRLPSTELIRGYELISQLAPLIAEHQGKGTMAAVLLGPDDPPQKIQLGNYTLEVARLGPEPCLGRHRAGPAAPAPRGGNFHCHGA